MLTRARRPLWAALVLLASLTVVPPAQAAAEPLTITDFESDGVPSGVYAWGNDAPSTPAR